MRKNIVANVIGKFFGIMSNFLFIPFYIKYLGIETYSIISFTLIIVGILGIMDAGMTATLAREFAKQKSAEYNKKVLGTLELCYWGMIFLIIIITFLAAAPIVNHWINLKMLSPKYVKNSIRIFGIVIAFQLISNFYLGGFFGLQKQVFANIFQIIWGIFKNGIVIIVIMVHPSLIYFFLWQAVVTICYALILRYNLLNTISNSQSNFFQKVKFDNEIFGEIKKFAFGMLIIAIIAALNMQLDKIAISNLLPINELGYYNLAVSLSSAIVFVVMPISVALLPKFTGYFTTGKIDEANRLFGVTFSFILIIVATISSLIATHGSELIYIWTGNHIFAKASSSYISFTAIGYAVLAMQVIPYDIAVANGNTKINTYMGVVSIVFTIPGYWISVKYWGALGAALTWCISQSILTPIFIYLISKKYLIAYTYIEIILKRVLYPMGMAFFISYLSIWIMPKFENRILGLIYLIILGIIILLSVTIVCSPIKISKKSLKELQL